MRNGTQRTHSYFAEAHALSGQLKNPILPIAQVLLQGEGDGVCERNVEVDFSDGVSVKLHGHTHVSGQWDANNRVWITRATSEVRGLNVSTNGRVIVAADLMSAVMTSIHYYDQYWYVPSVDCKLTYEGLRVADTDVTPVIMPVADVFGPGRPAEEYDPKTNPKVPGDVKPYLKEFLCHQPFIDNVQKQQKKIASKTPPQCAQQAFTVSREEVRCSLVKDTGLSANAFGHLIEIPGIGWAYLGELTVKDHFDLNLLRLDMPQLGKGFHLTIGGPAHNGATRP